MVSYRILALSFAVALASTCTLAQTSGWDDFRTQVALAFADGATDRLQKLHPALDTLDVAPAGWTAYWSAYLHYRASFLFEETDAQVPALEACLRESRAAVEAAAGDMDNDRLRGEAQALVGACHSSMAGTDSSASMRHGPRASMLRDESLVTAPDNPRVLLLAGVQDVWTPVQWGGSPERAVRRLERALERLDEDRPTAAWQPRWGRSDAIGHLALALDRLDRREEARAVLDRARADGHWNGWLDWVHGQLSAPPAS